VEHKADGRRGRRFRHTKDPTLPSRSGGTQTGVCMNVLLVNAYEDPALTAGRYSRFLRPMPPISIAYVAAALEKAGVSVTFYDDHLERGNRAKFFDLVRRCQPGLVGFSAVTPMANGLYRLARDLKASEPSLPIVMGNIHADLFADRILRQGIADYIVHGEGEETAPELVRTLANGGDAAAVAGVSFRRNGQVVHTPARPHIQDLDSLPFPAWHLFPIDRYEIFNFASVKKPGALILGSRGCPYKCNFCCLKIMGTRRRSRSPAQIADEALWLHDRFGYRQFSFTDPIFPLTKKEGLTFCAELFRRDLPRRMVWITETRVDLVDLELLRGMREAGLRRIMYGFESGSEEGLGSIRKNASLADARNAVALTRKAGVDVIGFFILGVPGDTHRTMDATIEFARSLDIDFAKFTVFSPFPGTKIYEELRDQGRIEDSESWERFTNYPSPRNPPIYLPDGVSLRDIVRYQRKALLRFYLRPGLILRHLFKIRTLGWRDVVGAVSSLIPSFRAGTRSAP